MNRLLHHCLLVLVCISLPATHALAGVGDPQIRTDHPWYPGELAYSTFERLFEAQAIAFERVTGHRPQSDQDRVLAAWMWRNQHYAHGEEGKQNLWGSGFKSGDTTTREYWTGLFAHGFGLCGTTHAQWTAELNALLGPGRSRTVGVVGHNSCEVYLTGGQYGDGRWVLLDHDISTVVFDPTGRRLLSIEEIRKDLARLTNPNFQPKRQHGWPLGGLHPDDPSAFKQFRVVEHLPGYAGPPPTINLRRGETLRRYFQPGLDDQKTFVFWGRNYRSGNIPGPERNRTWVNQPERFKGTPEGSGYRPGQVRYANAVSTYQPNFRDGTYREGVVSEDNQSVTFEFQTPYIIAATPPDDSDWGVYNDGCKNGLVVRGHGDATIAVSVDRGQSWQDCGRLNEELDLTDWAKGHQQYWIKIGLPANKLAGAGLEITTVCQANPSILPRLTDNGSVISFASSGRGVVSAGPNRDQAIAHLIDGAFDSPKVTLAIEPPRQANATHLYAAAHVASSNPPDPNISYQIEYSVDDGATWRDLVRDWKIRRRGVEPKDFWSQSFCYGDVELPQPISGAVQVRFRNNGGKKYLRAEAHLAYAVKHQDRCRVSFAWSDDQKANRTAEKVLSTSEASNWNVDTGKNVVMNWVQFEPVP